MWLKLQKQMFHTPKGKGVHTLAASTLASQKWCEVKAWLMASGVKFPPTEATISGSNIHADIEKARQLSPKEKQFKQFISQFLNVKDERGGTIGRPWINGKLNITAELGEIRTHGMDDYKVVNHEVTNIEYKTKGGWQVQPVSLMPALFQTQIYMWILEPYLLLGGYHWKESWIVWLKRKRGGKFEPIGETKVTSYNPTELQEEIQDIFNRWEKASKAKTNRKRREILIPPKKWKCIRCQETFKKQCPFQVV